MQAQHGRYDLKQQTCAKCTEWLKHTHTNTSLLTCVGRHSMRSTWLKSGVVHDILSNKSVPQRELMGETIPPRLSCLLGVMRSPSRLPRCVSWFKVHKMFKLKKKKKSPAFKTFSCGGVLSINQLLSPRIATLSPGGRGSAKHCMFFKNEAFEFLVVSYKCLTLRVWCLAVRMEGLYSTHSTRRFYMLLQSCRNKLKYADHRSFIVFCLINNLF